jgi:hypothetical protein
VQRSLFDREDFISKHFSVDILAPLAGKLPSAMNRRLYRRLKPLSKNLGQLMIKDLNRFLTQYDLIILHCMGLSEIDLFRDYILSGSGIKIICSIEDVWPHNIDQQVHERNLLKECDTVISNCYHAVQHLKTKFNFTNAYYLPPSLDAIACYEPAKIQVKRSIDLYYMGRRIEKRHAKFVHWSNKSGAFYFFDTAGNVPMIDHREHRKRYINILNRTKLFVVSPGKVVNPLNEVLPEEIGYRYFEGAACGTVMIGDIPNSPVFKECFDYPNPVLPIPDSDELNSFLEEYTALSSDPFYPTRIAGLKNILEHFDHAHWWNKLMKYSGFGFDDNTSPRLEQLNRMVVTLKKYS